MDSKNITGIRKQLLAELTTLQDASGKLRGELTSIESDQRKISAAIAALDGKQSEPMKKAKKTRKSSKPAASRAEVIKCMNAILKEGGVLSVDELKEQIEAKIKQKGFSRMGLALRFKEALGDEQFLDSPGGVRLASEADKLVEA